MNTSTRKHKPVALIAVEHGEQEAVVSLPSGFLRKCLIGALGLACAGLLLVTGLWLGARQSGRSVPATGSLSNPEKIISPSVEPEAPTQEFFDLGQRNDRRPSLLDIESNGEEQVWALSPRSVSHESGSDPSGAMPVVESNQRPEEPITSEESTGSDDTDSKVDAIPEDSPSSVASTGAGTGKARTDPKAEGKDTEQDEKDSVGDSGAKPAQVVPETSYTFAGARTWTNQDGKKVDAGYVSSDEKMVKLRLRNAQMASVPLAKLSKEDQEYVAALNSKMTTALRELGMAVTTGVTGNSIIRVAQVGEIIDEIFRDKTIEEGLPSAANEVAKAMPEGSFEITPSKQPEFASLRKFLGNPTFTTTEGAGSSAITWHLYGWCHFGVSAEPTPKVVRVRVDCNRLPR